MQPTFLIDDATTFPRRPHTKICPYMDIKKQENTTKHNRLLRNRISIALKKQKTISAPTYAHCTKFSTTTKYKSQNYAQEE